MDKQNGLVEAYSIMDFIINTSSASDIELRRTRRWLLLRHRLRERVALLWVHRGSVERIAVSNGREPQQFNFPMPAKHSAPKNSEKNYSISPRMSFIAYLAG